MQVVMQGGSEEYNIIDACADVMSRCESLKGMSERSDLIPCHYTNLTVVRLSVT